MSFILKNSSLDHFIFLRLIRRLIFRIYIISLCLVVYIIKIMIKIPLILILIMSVLVVKVFVWHSIQIYFNVLFPFALSIINFFIVNISSIYSFHSSFSGVYIICKCSHILINLQIGFKLILFYTAILVMHVLQIFQVKFSYIVRHFTISGGYLRVVLIRFRCCFR